VIGGRLVFPCRECPDKRLLHRVLVRREVGTATDEDAQDLGDELAELDILRVHWEGSLGDGQRRSEERSDLQPFVDRLAAGAGRC